ncbi:ATP-binding cassette domain-containing protein [Deinococcus sp. YIM 77859]|uniref:ATP-binding cassette domain-containing protein n=1 Tax=Deinococcus sp. YIM 77859 TaxID=1540221 RepID=UPI000A9681E5|nr:ATP-binding cassette domain-containing protein [Deinococcus sp. YIM 77859]
MTTQIRTGMALQVHNVTRRFGGVTALKDISLDVAPSERHAVIGPNGAGKSTLFRVVSGEYPPSAGTVRLDGRSVNGLSPDRVAALGVARSFQTSSLFPQDSVRENVILAVMAHLPARRDLWRPLRAHREAVRRADAALERMDLLAQADLPAAALSHGEQRQLELAMVLAQEPRLLLLDEPLAGLSAHEREHVQNLIKGLPRELTTVLIEHDLPFCLAFADRITVLSNGERLATGTPDAIRANEAVQAVYVGSALKRQGRERSEVAWAQPPVLTAQSLSAGYGSAAALENVSLVVRPGEVVTVLGRNGMGKTTLLTTLMGWRRPTGGKVTLNGQDVTALRPSGLSARGLALVPQGRRMLAELTVDEELRLAVRPGKWTLARVYETFPRLLERRSSLSTTLSGGEQQMVAIGRALLQNPSVMLLDEPTEGLSPLMVTVVRDVLLTLRESGETILLAEQNLDLALAVADRVYVLDHGTVAFEGDAAHLAENRALVHELMGV